MDAINLKEPVIDGAVAVDVGRSRIPPGLGASHGNRRLQLVGREARRYGSLGYDDGRGVRRAGGDGAGRRGGAARRRPNLLRGWHYRAGRGSAAVHPGLE